MSLSTLLGRLPAGSRRATIPWLASFALSFILYAAIGIQEMTWHPFWHQLHHPHADSGAFAILCSTLAGTYAIAITVYFAGLAAISVAGVHQARVDALVKCIGTWWLFPAALFWYLSVNLIVGVAWGFPSFLTGIVVLICIGPFAVLGFAVAGVNAVRTLWML